MGGVAAWENAPKSDGAARAATRWAALLLDPNSGPPPCRSALPQVRPHAGVLFPAADQVRGRADDHVLQVLQLRAPVERPELRGRGVRCVDLRVCVGQWGTCPEGWGEGAGLCRPKGVAVCVGRLWLGGSVRLPSLFYVGGDSCHRHGSVPTTHRSSRWHDGSPTWGAWKCRASLAAPCSGDGRRPCSISDAMIRSAAWPSPKGESLP